jgi:hypothetical protein
MYRRGNNHQLANLGLHPAFSRSGRSGPQMPQPDTDSPMIRQSPAQDRRCPNCELSLRLLQGFLDIRANRIARVFECGNCGKLIWDD